MSIKNGALLAVAAGALVLSGCSMFTSHDTDATPAAATPAVKTAGASHACKGMNACKGKHACKGKNACKGMKQKKL